MSEYPRPGNPTSTLSNLNELHAKGKLPTSCMVQKDAQTKSLAIEATRKPTLSKFAQKMKGLFFVEKTKTTLTEEDAEAEERKRAAAIDLVGMNAFFRP
ncbi:hypothetical protein PHYBOEH_000406 [Phytophthora boehmeriae]|uniref:Uncharacterized protein n=1 Tax=Phytophthora boehmeriae TaxID=109152 RepID=A0A8T1WUY5_9STRA|nr:hypothetical protein PHYBOEH_000406 [Phytophthora boehmeriae]